eukprot:Sdes_comp20485_c0_seq1m14867
MEKSSGENIHNPTVEEDTPVVKVDKYCIPSVKNALDDGIKNAISKVCGFEESFWITDLKLFICILGSLFAFIAVGYSYFVPYPLCKPVLTFCVALYFSITLSLSLFVFFVEKDIIMIGKKTNEDDSTEYHIKISTVLPRYSEFLTITATLTENSSSSVPKTHTIKRSIANWIDESGYVAEEILTKDIRHLVAKIEKKGR